jgi:hypothetical protein
VENKILITKVRYIKSIFIIFFLLISHKATAPNLNFTLLYVPEPIDAYSRLINAVVHVESKGDTMAFNLTENAIGAFQIRPIRILDYNQRTGNHYKIENCYNFKVSKEIFLYYAKLTGFLDYETIARNWNGSGKATLEYWEKVKSHL